MSFYYDDGGTVEVGLGLIRVVPIENNVAHIEWNGRSEQEELWSALVGWLSLPPFLRAAAVPSP